MKANEQGPGCVYIYIRNKNPKIKNGFEYGGTQHGLQKQTLITIL